MVLGSVEESEALDFEAHDTLYATHGLHAFAAKCPPPLARWAIERYSEPGDTVLDPMVGSGTTLVEAVLTGRHAVGADLDPLARLIAKVKATPIPLDVLDDAIGKLMRSVDSWMDVPACAAHELPALPRFERWFSPSVATTLAALKRTIAGLEIAEDARDFLWVAFSSLITARTSVANARDLVHSRHHYRPHPMPPDVPAILRRRLQVMRRQMAEYVRLREEAPLATRARVLAADARSLPLADGSAQLVFTSPPYCNALDYTRAHTFSVAWLDGVLGMAPAEYVRLGREYIGSERGAIRDGAAGEVQSALVGELIRAVGDRDPRRGRIVARYFNDMARVMREAGRVLCPSGVLVLVVCPSHIRKIEISTHRAFVELATTQADPTYRWLPLAVHERVIDDRRRLLPYMQETFGHRMRTEYVVVLRKEARDER